jgi:hypothetical protein
MEVKTCSVDGCNNVPFVSSTGMCMGCAMIADGEALKTHERPIDRPMALLHHTKKMYQDKRL